MKEAVRCSKMLLKKGFGTGEKSLYIYIYNMYRIYILLSLNIRKEEEDKKETLSTYPYIIQRLIKLQGGKNFSYHFINGN